MKGIDLSIKQNELLYVIYLFLIKNIPGKCQTCNHYRGILENKSTILCFLTRYNFYYFFQL